MKLLPWLLTIYRQARREPKGRRWWHLRSALLVRLRRSGGWGWLVGLLERWP
jgi:hypothetical protein